MSFKWTDFTLVIRHPLSTTNAKWSLHTVQRLYSNEPYVHCRPISWSMFQAYAYLTKLFQSLQNWVEFCSSTAGVGGHASVDTLSLLRTRRHAAPRYPAFRPVPGIKAIEQTVTLPSRHLHRRPTSNAFSPLVATSAIESATEPQLDLNAECFWWQTRNCSINEH